MERIPIDKAVMEKADNVRVLEVTYDWSDVGDWRSLAELLPARRHGQHPQGRVHPVDTKRSILISDDGGLIATLGVEDLVVIQSGGATLVARSRPDRPPQGAGRRTRRGRPRGSSLKRRAGPCEGTSTGPSGTINRSSASG